MSEQESSPELQAAQKAVIEKLKEFARNTADGISYSPNALDDVKDEGQRLGMTRKEVDRIFADAWNEYRKTSQEKVYRSPKI